MTAADAPSQPSGDRTMSLREAYVVAIVGITSPLWFLWLTDWLFRTSTNTLMGGVCILLGYLWGNAVPLRDLAKGGSVVS